MAITIIIYLFGFFVTYWLTKQTRLRKSHPPYWSDVILSFFFSLFSLIGVIAMLLILLMEYEPSNDSKPPKWM